MAWVERAGRARDGVRRRLRERFPDRPVTRDVQGTRLRMPWEHRLPDLTMRHPAYGQNLVELARGLGHEDFSMIDVGANIGDSAKQVRAAQPSAWVLCVEGDPHYLPFLRHNVRDDPQVVIEASLLMPDDSPVANVSPRRSRGTTRFQESSTSGSLPLLSVRALPDRLAGLPPVRLIKSDTDGFDTVLVPALAASFAETRPLLFFEYDEALSRQAGDPVPAATLTRLVELGYATVAVWDNFGTALGHTDLADAALLDRLHADVAAGLYNYWDLAAAHRDDKHGTALLKRCAPAGLEAARTGEHS